MLYHQLTGHFTSLPPKSTLEQVLTLFAVTITTLTRAISYRKHRYHVENMAAAPTTVLDITKSCIRLFDEYMRREDDIPSTAPGRRDYNQMQEAKVHFMEWYEKMSVFGAPGRGLDARLREHPRDREFLVSKIKILIEHIQRGL